LSFCLTSSFDLYVEGGRSQVLRPNTHKQLEVSG
jgi:hypothetical protein